MNEIKYNYKIYGRHKGRKGKKINLDSYEELISSYSNHSLNVDNYNILDIGSGNGENALYLSNNIKNKIIVCEKFIDGNINLVNKILKNNIKNISIYDGNVNKFLDDLISEEFFSEIWILFPDPWPKKRHHKRRLINSFFFEKLNKFLKRGSYIFIATDSKSYLREILYSMFLIKNIFCWENQTNFTWDYENNSLPETKYYKKAIKSGRKPFFIKLRKL